MNGVLTHNGQQRHPSEVIFYAFNLDDAVPQDHLLRSIDHFLDLSEFVTTMLIAYRFTL